MKVFVFTNLLNENNYIGGAEIQAYLLADYLAKKNHQVNYVVWDGVGQTGEKSFGKFLVNYLSGTDQGLFKHLKSFEKLCREKKPDICFVRNFNYLFVFAYVCWKLKIPLVYNTTHIENCQIYPKKLKFSKNPKIFLGSLKFALLHLLSFWALRFVNVITINRYQAELLKKYKIKATPIYNSMPDNYPANKLPQKENKVVWVANLKARKRPDLFIKLADELKETGWQFIMIGYLQNNIESYKNLISETQKNNSNFKYLGGMPAEETDKILASAKIFVNTCLPEGFGNNFIQAWFNECPSVTLDFDADDIMVKNKIGFHSGSFEQMAKDVKFLIDNPQTTEEMGKRARQWALNNHLPATNMPKYEEYFNRLIKK